MAQSASSTCEICASAPGHYYCQQCDQMFCQNCKTGHLRSKMAKNHTFLTGGEINKEIKLHCKQHDELFIYYCIQCNTQVCKTCNLKSHNGHNMADLSEHAEKMKNEMKEKIEVKMRSLEANAAKLEERSSTYRQEVKTAIRSITDEGNRLKQIIDRKVAELIQRIKENETKQLKTLTKMQENFKRDIENVKKYRKQLETFQQTTYDDKLNEQLKQLQSDVEKVSVQSLPSMPTLSYHQQQAKEIDLSELFGSLNIKEMTELAGGQNLQQTLRRGKYLYSCDECGTEQRSDEKPKYILPRGAFLFCENCGKKQFHCKITEKR